MKKFIIFVSLLSMNSYAKSTHREHGAHKHGSATLSIAFDGMNGKIEFKSPSDSIFGFEHEATTEFEKKSKTEGLQKLEDKIGQMILFQPDQKCVITKDKTEVIPEKEDKNHSDVIATYNVVCEKSVEGSKITFNIQKYFPSLKDVDVTILSGSIQASGEAKKNSTVIEVK